MPKIHIHIHQLIQMCLKIFAGFSGFFDGKLDIVGF